MICSFASTDVCYHHRDKTICAAESSKAVFEYDNLSKMTKKHSNKYHLLSAFIHRKEYRRIYEYFEDMSLLVVLDSLKSILKWMYDHNPHILIITIRM